MKPYQILAFLISVFLVLGLLAKLIPASGFKLPGNVTMDFISIDEIISEEPEYADISKILSNSSVINKTKNPIVTSTPVEEQLKEPIILRANPDSLKKNTWLIELPNNDPSFLYPVFNTLSRLKSSRELVRIMHYGDSQIEADRMTSFIRNKLQLLFGGSGVGFIPVIPQYNGKMSIQQKYSSNWERFVGFAKRDSTIDHEKYGPLFSFNRYKNSKPGDKAWLSYSPSAVSYSSSRHYNQFSLYIGGKSGDSRMLIRMNDELVDSVNLTAVEGFKKLTWKSADTPATFNIEFSGNGSPEVYGITIDKSWGVAVDNIPLRGSSGLVFSKNDTIFLKKMYKELNVGMLILQFGGNIIPHQAKDYTFFEKMLRRELVLIKRMLPGVPVIVIGPSDMSMKENGRYVTYPSLEKVRNAMRKATLESGFAFWDMYEAMGGKNSMPSWVFADPPLASTDFVHFNPQGARIVAEMFYNAFIYEYIRWQFQNSEIVNGDSLVDSSQASTK